MKSILVTAFEPFGEDGINPTELILERLPSNIGGSCIHKLLLPVEFERAPELALKEAASLLPSAVVCLGQAGGRGAVTPELRAVNIMNARIPDNAGNRPVNEPIDPGGPGELASRLPVWEIVAHIRALGLPAEASYSAGEYVCNRLMYSVLAKTPGDLPAGFIHVPFIREQVEGVSGREKLPFMELDELLAAVTAALCAVDQKLN